MPSEYKNILIITGESEDIQLFNQKCKGWDSYYPDSKDDYSKEISDFLEKTVRSKHRVYKETMSLQEAYTRAYLEAQEEVEQKFRPRTEEEIQNAIEINRKKHFDVEPYFCLNVLYPEPESNYGIENWREWRYENWGCKWANVLEFESSGDEIKITLEAANGNIIPWVIEVSQDFPHLLFELFWEKEFYTGDDSCIIINGEMFEWMEDENQKYLSKKI